MGQGQSSDEEMDDKELEMPRCVVSHPAQPYPSRRLSTTALGAGKAKLLGIRYVYGS